MNSLNYQKELLVKYETDVLVIGDGMAGIGSVISAARNGAKTILIEEMGCVGGMVTNGLI